MERQGYLFNVSKSPTDRGERTTSVVDYLLPKSWARRKARTAGISSPNGKIEGINERPLDEQRKDRQRLHPLHSRLSASMSARCHKRLRFRSSSDFFTIFASKSVRGSELDGSRGCVSWHGGWGVYGFCSLTSFRVYAFMRR